MKLTSRKLRKCKVCGAEHKNTSGYCAAHIHLQDRVTAQPTGEPIGNLVRGVTIHLPKNKE